MASEDERELGRRDAEMADIGRPAHFDGLEQRQSEIRPWAPGIYVPGQDTEIILGNRFWGTARSIQLNMPVSPTPRMHATYSAGRSPSVSLREAALVQDFMRLPVPPTFMMRAQPTVDSSRRNVPVFGNTLTLPSSVESGPEISSRLLPQSTVSIQEIPEMVQLRAVGGMSPFRTSNGALTRAQQRRAQQQHKKQVHTSPISKNDSSAAVENNGWNQQEEENFQRTTRHSSESVDAKIASETSLKYPAHWGPDKNELERLLRQIEWETETSQDSEIDVQQKLREIGDRLKCARKIITELVELKRRIQDDNDDLAAKNRNLESENIDLAVCKNDLEETCVKLESKYAVVADQFERLKAEYEQTQQNYLALDKLRVQISGKNKHLTQRIQEIIQEKETLSSRNIQLESAQNVNAEEFQKVVQELEQSRIDRETAEQHAANIAANTRPGPASDREFQLLRDRLGVYSRKALDMNYDFKPENPPLNSRIFQLVQDTVGVSQGPSTSAPPQSAPAPFQFNAAAQPFVTTTPSAPVMPVAVPSGLDSTQPATSQTQQQAPATNIPKLPKPRTFSVKRGGDSYMDFKKWTAEIKSYLILSKVDPALWAECATYCLEGFVKQRMWKEFGLYTNQHARKMDFDEFCSFMLEKIIPPRNPALAGMQLERITYQHGSETLSAFKDRILDNLQTQKGDVPLADVDYETAKVQFLNKLPGSYKVFIYQQNWVMENPTLDNHQRAAEMYEASHDLGLGESPFGPRTYQLSRPEPREKSYQRSRSRTRNWAPAPMRGGRAGYRNLSGRKPAGGSPSNSSFNPDRSRVASSSPSFDRGQYQPFSFAQPASQNSLSAVQCYACQKFGHLARDCKEKRTMSTNMGARKSSKSPVRKAKVHSIQVEELDTIHPRSRDSNIGESLDSDSEDFIQGDYPTILETTPSFCHDQILYTYGTRILDESNKADCMQAVIEDFSEDALAVGSFSSTDISTDICYVNIQESRTNQTCRPRILHNIVFDLYAVIPCMLCGERFLPLAVSRRPKESDGHPRIQLSSGMDSEQSSRQELEREAKAKSKEEREKARQLEQQRKQQKKSGARPKTSTGSAKKKTISPKKKIAAKPQTKARQRQQSQESISSPSAAAAIEVVKVEDEEMESDPSQPPGIIISDHDPDISIMFETEEELYNQYTTEKYWESQVDKVSLIPTYVARNVCKSFDPLNKDLYQELLGLEPLSFYVSMSYQDLDRSLEELKRDPNHDPQVEQYFESLIADHLATFPAEHQAMAKECLLKFLYRRMVRYYFGSRLHLRDYIQNNPGVPVEIALDHLYGLGVNTRTNAVLIEDQAKSEMWEAEAGAENYEVIEEIECSEGEEAMETEMAQGSRAAPEFDKYYETLIPPKRPPPRVERTQEAAGIHYPAIVDLVSVQNRKITGTTITNGNESVKRTVLYAYWLHQAVTYKQYPLSWEILLPLPAYGSTQTKRFYIGQFFDMTALPVSTERFPGAAILAELNALGWDVSLLYPIMSDQAFANRPATKIACFLRHVDFMLFLARLGEGKDIVFREVMQTSEFLYFPEFPTVEDFLQLYQWVKNMPERSYQYTPESFAGSSMENYNRIKWSIRTFCEQKLNSKTGWNLETEQFPIGRRRRDVNDLTTEPPPPVYRINRTTKRGIPKWLPPIRTAPPPRKAKYPEAARSDTVISQAETTNQISATASISLGGIGRGIPPESASAPPEREERRAQFLEKIGKAVSKEKIDEEYNKQRMEIGLETEKDEATYAERMATPEDLHAIYDASIQTVAGDASNVDLDTPGLDNLTVRTDSIQ